MSVRIEGHTDANGITTYYRVFTPLVPPTPTPRQVTPVPAPVIPAPETPPPEILKDNPYIYKTRYYDTEEGRYKLKVELKLPHQWSKLGQSWMEKYNARHGTNRPVYNGEEVVGPYRAAAIHEITKRTYNSHKRKLGPERQERLERLRHRRSLMQQQLSR